MSACSKPSTFHNGFMFLLLVAVSSTFRDLELHLFYKSRRARNLKKCLKQIRESKKMKPLWKVKGFEQHILWNARVPDCDFVRKEQKSDTDMYMPPLVHVRTLFSSPPLVVSSLSSFVFFPLSFSVFFLALSLSVSVCCCVSVVFWCVCLCVLGEEVTVCALKTPPCVHSKRPRVNRHHAHMCFNMRAWCRYTRRSFKCTHGDF